ncbi:MAG TPA: endonuclease domain-containing protein [Bacteroidia bacterium]|nr:endonuclease domain-containing protein [Bacteroidia bacterium]
MKRINAPFYYGASPEMLKRAERLREEMTETELLLWERLRKNKNGSYRFRAQHPIGKFIADFYCHEVLLVIEIDGGIHQNEIVAERDEGRELEITNLGIKVIRFTNDEILNDLEKVATTISRVLDACRA